ncbi:hypothetical protein ADUPG1_000898 [Aduncisulcus paluster]|uniref:Uncharacterized protein n=1 Tax=Aduncisulcus paluster TaxID=2918883 RepID=A0ABQ5K8J7_9EUKA|nr:hypothetical protein ADUPG1_000898 [Aduncisulcus paluster]
MILISKTPSGLVIPAHKSDFSIDDSVVYYPNQSLISVLSDDSISALQTSTKNIYSEISKLETEKELLQKQCRHLRRFPDSYSIPTALASFQDSIDMMLAEIDEYRDDSCPKRKFKDSIGKKRTSKDLDCENSDSSLWDAKRLISLDKSFYAMYKLGLQRRRAVLDMIESIIASSESKESTSVKSERSSKKIGTKKSIDDSQSEIDDDLESDDSDPEICKSQLCVSDVLEEIGATSSDCSIDFDECKATFSSIQTSFERQSEERKESSRKKRKRRGRKNQDQTCPTIADSKYLLGNDHCRSELNEQSSDLRVDGSGLVSDSIALHDDRSDIMDASFISMGQTSRKEHCTIRPGKLIYDLR